MAALDAQMRDCDPYEILTPLDGAHTFAFPTSWSRALRTRVPEPSVMHLVERATRGELPWQ